MHYEGFQAIKHHCKVYKVINAILEQVTLSHDFMVALSDAQMKMKNILYNVKTLKIMQKYQGMFNFVSYSRYKILEELHLNDNDECTREVYPFDPVAEVALMKPFDTPCPFVSVAEATFIPENTSFN
jgi:hypothetical protein